MSEPTKLFRYHGRSMWPCFQEGDMVEIVAVTKAEIRRGDCIAYHTEENQTVVHRVVTIRDFLTTQGDALPSVDINPVLPEQIRGKVIRRYRLGRPIAVRSGRAGQIAGYFYRYAGRIDPQRMSRGGQLARSIRLLCTAGLNLCRYRGEPKVLKRAEGQDVIILNFGPFVVGRQKPPTHEWFINWPWSIILKFPGRA